MIIFNFVRMIRMVKKVFLCILPLLIISMNQLKAQGSNPVFSQFSDIEIRIDTNVFSYHQNRIKIAGEQYIPFEFSKNNSIVELRLYKKANSPAEIKLLTSNDYSIQDSLQLINGRYYRAKIQFNNLSTAAFTGIKLSTSTTQMLFLPIYPYSNTYATIYPGEGEVFIGEEKSFEVVSNNESNIVIDERWKQGDGFEYRFTRKGAALYYSLLPTRSGKLMLPFQIELLKPNFLNGKPVFTLETQIVEVTARGSRLSFLRFDEREVIWEREIKAGVEVQIENHRLLQLNKTYRLEDSDTPGGPLIAELLTVRRLTNDKVLCVLRPYNYHNQADGYLYLKEGDDPRFITNITIVPEPKIDRISILRKGGQWVESNVLYPGETVEVRLEGESLNRTRFYFEDVQDVSTDTLLRNENAIHFKLHVPISIKKKSVSIYNKRSNTGKTLDIREHQRPRELDFVWLSMEGRLFVPMR